MPLSPEVLAEERAYAMRRLRAAAGTAIDSGATVDEVRAEVEAGIAEVLEELDRRERAAAEYAATPPPPPEHGPALTRLLAVVDELDGRHRAA
jgi:hypothetical protein